MGKEVGLGKGCLRKKAIKAPEAERPLRRNKKSTVIKHSCALNIQEIEAEGSGVRDWPQIRCKAEARLYKILPQTQTIKQ